MTDEDDASISYRIFCLACAGGGVSHFYRWKRVAGEGVQVVPLCLPGRDTRYREPLLTSFDEIVDDLEQTVSTQCDRPFAVFGHSMGALLAYELIRRLTKKAVVADLLMVAACHPPHVGPREPVLHQLENDAFVSELRKRYGEHGDVLKRPESRRIFLPIIRADLEAVESHVADTLEPLPCPIVVSYGRDDLSIFESEIETWNRYSERPTSIHPRDGNHFFVEQDREWILETIDTQMRAKLAPAEG